MEITTRTYSFINFHRAEIISTLDYQSVLRTIEELTTLQRPRLGRARYKGTYRLDTPFTGIVSPERIDLYWWKPLYPRKHLRIRGTLTISTKSILSLRSGSLAASTIEILAVLMAATILVLAVVGPDNRGNMFRFVVIFIGGITWFFIASNRRRTAFDAAVNTIADEITAREAEEDVPGNRTRSRRRDPQ